MSSDAPPDDPPMPPFTISPLQRARMEANRRLALARQQLRRGRPRDDDPGVNTISGATAATTASITVTTPDPVLTPQQEAVVRAVQRGRSVFVTGSAGTGKSFLLGHIVAALRQIHQPDTVFITASTGIAACAIGGQTLHSFAGVGLGQGDKDALLHRAATSKAATKRWRRAAALVLDEVSMIDGGLFDALEYIARALRCPTGGLRGGGGNEEGGLKTRWGGIQLVVTGDFFQLPPVNAPNPAKEFAFEADCWDSSFDLQVELTRVFRQSDSRLIQLLQGIRRGEQAHHHLLPLFGAAGTTKGSLGTAGHRDDDDNVTRLYPRNNDVRRVNEERLSSLGREVVSFVAVDTGFEPGRGQLRQGIAPDVLELCVGARVMLIKNTDLAIGLVNGSTGVVIGFVEGKADDNTDRKEGASGGGLRLLPRVRFDSSGVEVTVEPDRWDVVEGDTVLATRMQVPLILAWALSVHKCQGMTLDRLHTDLSRAFGCGMVYVALSRVRSLDGLRLSGFDARKIKAHPKVIHFYDCLSSSLPPVGHEGQCGPPPAVATRECLTPFGDVSGF